MLEPLQVKFFVNQFKCMIRKIFKVLVLKVATSGLHLNLMQLHDYSSNRLLYQL